MQLRHLAAVILSLLLVNACDSGKGSGGASNKCLNSATCERGTVCQDGSCKEVACSSHVECAQGVEDGTFCWAGAGLCTAVECSNVGGIGCAVGFECIDFLCLQPEAECGGNWDCKQPAEKCLKNKCVDRDFCEADDDCANGFCVIEEQRCHFFPPDTIEPGDVTGDALDDAGPLCPVPDPPPELSELLCRPCELGEECSCAPGTCIDLDGKTVCMTACENAWDCPSGFKCSAGNCDPTGIGCAGCVVPAGQCGPGEACDFGAGTCGDAQGWCEACTFDYQCGAGNRCASAKSGVGSECVPECSHEGFKCPLSSGCNPREDGVFVCLSLGIACCFGPDCDNCPCLSPTPFCQDGGGCVQCTMSTDCPLDHPFCNPETHSCELACGGATPVYWHDPETGQEQCVTCLNSLDHCPMGWYCGVDEEDPETYHICYEIL
ncbi:MAG: hypothetical protein ABIK09_02155 [Pseudomonadota bacterium]